MTARRRSTAVAARGTAMFAAAVLATAGCGGNDAEDADYQSTCHDQNGVRVEDDLCDDDNARGGGFLFFPIFWPLGFRYPALGQNYNRYGGGVRTLPAGSTGVRGGAAAAGGTVTRAGIRSAVSRGGFGTRSSGGGTGG